MIKNYLLITFRSMLKNKLFLLINILGMSFGIGSCIVGYFNWEYNHDFDEYHVNRKDVYRVSMVREFDGTSTLYGYAPVPLGDVVRQNFPDVEKSSRLSRSFGNFKRDDDLFFAELAYVDPDFFDIFTFEFIAGSPASIMDKSKVVINDEMSRKLYNTTDAVGKPITLVLDQSTVEMTVGGVFRKPPVNSSMQWASYANYDGYFDDATDVKEDSWNARNVLFVFIPESDRTDIVHKELQKYVENNNRVREDFLINEYTLDPFDGMANRDALNDRWAMTQNANPPASVVGPSMMALIILLVACFNLTNTSIAISSRRLKEIGIRKVMGSARAQLIAQFIGETLILCTVSLFLGLVVGELLIEGWNMLWKDFNLTSHYLDEPGFLIFIVGVLLATAVLAGSYPAFYISKFEPVSILKGKLKFGGTNYFTRTLLFLQYAFSLTAIIFAFAFYQNARYQQKFDLGFNQTETIVAYIDSQNEFETYRNALLQNKDIVSVAGSEHSVFSYGYNDPVKHESKQIEADIINIGDDYLKTMGLTVIQGREFRKDSETDRKESVLVSEELVGRFGWTDPLGKELIWMDTVKLYVVGVVKNVYTNGVWRKTEPLMIRYASPDKYRHVIVRAPADKLASINGFMEQEWKKIFPTKVYNGRMMDEELKDTIETNINIVAMFVFLGIVAVFLSATGLFTLVSLNIIKRMKEIGVRKVLGASVGNITRIINTEFAIILLFSAIGGSALSYLLVDLLMDSIWDYYQATQPAVFILSIVLLVVISALTIAFKVRGAATTNPVQSLRTE